MIPKTFLSVVGVGLAAIAPVKAQSKPVDNGLALSLINEERASHGVAPLTWSADLQNNAHIWADHMTSVDELVHASEHERPGQGEVIAHFRLTDVDKDADVLSIAITTWLSGGESYPEGGVVGNDDNVWDHWSQLVWSTTTDIGCAVSAEVNSTDAYTVCRLTPEGNIIGQPPFPDNSDTQNSIPTLASRQDLSPGPFKGEATFYDTGLGACGDDDTGKNGIAALSHLKMGSPSNNNPLCNRRVSITGPKGTATATVKDKCMGCAEEDIDLSLDVFEKVVGGAGIGRAQVTWELQG